jgi:hypothetical protein
MPGAEQAERRGDGFQPRDRRTRGVLLKGSRRPQRSRRLNCLCPSARPPLCALPHQKLIDSSSSDKLLIGGPPGRMSLSSEAEGR